jgi:peptide/nickel transport system permease protein
MVRRSLRRLIRDPEGRFGLAILSILVLTAVLAPVLSGYDPLEVSAGPPLAGPSAAHWLGTDDLGRDEMSRILYGARISLSVSVLSAVGALLVAVSLGLVAGYGQGVGDTLIGRVFDTLAAFPDVLLGVGAVAILGAGIANVVIAVALVNVPTLGRLTRSSVMVQRSEEYVLAARALGASDSRVMTRHVLPNVVPPLIVQTTIILGSAVLLEAAFSFLGLGSRPPAPSWGTMLDEGRKFLRQAPWLGIAPGLAITVTILGFNALGDAARVALDPRRAS